MLTTVIYSLLALDQTIADDDLLEQRGLLRAQTGRQAQIMRDTVRAFAVQSTRAIVRSTFGA